MVFLSSLMLKLLRRGPFATNLIRKSTLTTSAVDAKASDDEGKADFSENPRNNSVGGGKTNPAFLSSIRPFGDLEPPQRYEEEIDFKLIRVKPSKVRIRGGIKKMYFNAASLAGNGQGGIGIGTARGLNSFSAVQKSQKNALKNMEYFPMYENRTLFHDQYLKYQFCRLKCWSVPPKNGVRAHYTIQYMCYLMGMKDLSARILGSSNPVVVANAFLRVLRLQKTPEQVALDSGLFVHDINEAFRYQHHLIVKHNLEVEKNMSSDQMAVDVAENPHQ